MQQHKAQLSSIGIRTEGILLPKDGTDLTRWAVVACDQYTSEPDYWHRVESFIGEAASTLRLIFPEVWLERENDAQKQERISRINASMETCLSSGLLESHDGPVLTERTTRDGHRRLGLVLSLDLDQYDFSVGSRSLIRATEGTILDRLPPRIRIREKAGLELPHIMILIDDPAARVIEPLFEAVWEQESQKGISNSRVCKVYDFPLMENSGSLRGWTLHAPHLLDAMAAALSDLANPDHFHARYGTDADTAVLLYAVGDGNHSLATAKSCWEQIKQGLSEAERQTHPARHALVELVNVHDAGLVFEPIHRVLFGVDPDPFLSDFTAWHDNRGIRTAVVPRDAPVPFKGPSVQSCTMISPGREMSLCWENPRQQLAVGSLQGFLDEWLYTRPDSMLDYVHGEDVTRRHGREKGNMGFLLPAMGKESLFPTVIRDGALPRKTFSMGEAHEKRFYLESRRIRS